MLLKDKVVFLTGGSSGIGRDCANAYKKEDALIALFAKDPEGVEKTQAELGAGHLGLVGDVSIAESVRTAVEKVLREYGRIDAVHNNAGIATPSKSLHETTEEEWDALMNVNLKSLLHTARYTYPALKKSRGCILNTSSLVGVIGQESHAAYVASKGGMNALTKAMALDYAADRIRVNAVCPAGAWTPMLRKWSQEQPDPGKIEKYLDEIHPLGHCPDGDVIADACVFLLSDRAKFITGHIMHVSGGAELGYRSGSSPESSLA
jgi:meso-butanediol dehydrogenase/(S,S)-butanediol dehydrogenase/diacetyl reductase